jgi:glutamate synthase (NADPH/NADH) large chain
MDGYMEKRDFLQGRGLYDANFERDACGLGFVASIRGEQSHEIIANGIQILVNLQHRGASGSDPVTGDGAGIMIQIPHAFFKRECARCGFTLPLPGEYGVGMMFLPVERHQRLLCEGIVERIAHEEGLEILGWRDTPLASDAIGRVARASQPYIQQVFVRRAPGMDQDTLERKLYIMRKRAEFDVTHSEVRAKEFFSIPSLSTRTIVYKGLLLATQIANFYKELSDPLTASTLCLVHQRFSTNTFPIWKLAHPFHYICHNGEINTVKGNIAWMEARQSGLASPLLGEDIKKLYPIVMPGGSDSAILDNVVELLYMSGRSLPHAMAMLIPEAWDRDASMPAEKRAFYEYHASLMEPWDGPAAIAFTDGRMIGATLDRNGLRPARYIVTHDDLVVMASETGVLPIKPEEIKVKGRLRPGRMLLVDLEAKEIIPDESIKNSLARRRPYAEWLKENQTTLEVLPDPPRWHPTDFDSILQRQRSFGYTSEELKRILTPMVSEGQEPIGSMGTDTPLACLSDKPQLLFNYFKQLFAQVTNPAIDPIREELVMSLTSFIGIQHNLLDETPQHCHMLKLPNPILTNHDLEKLRRLSFGDLLSTTLPMFFRVDGGGGELERALGGLCRRASLAIQSGYTLLILSDRGIEKEFAPIPSLLALTAVHNHLVREKTRTQVALIVESGEPREIMHFALLLGYGASVVNPYLAIETIEDLHRRGWLPEGLSVEDAIQNYKKAINKGLLKVFSKMGISTLQSYQGAQAFEAIGLNRSIIDKYFTGTPFWPGRRRCDATTLSSPS